jgi:hypothetical protein
MGDNSPLRWEKEAAKKQEKEKSRSLRDFIFAPPHLSIFKGTGIIGVIGGLILLIREVFLEGKTEMTGTYLLVILFGVIFFFFGVFFFKVIHWLKKH